MLYTNCFLYIVLLRSKTLLRFCDVIEMIMYVSLVRTLWGFWIFDYKLSVLLCISQCVQKYLCNAIPHRHHAFVEGLSQHMFSNFETQNVCYYAMPPGCLNFIVRSNLLASASQNVSIIRAPKISWVAFQRNLYNYRSCITTGPVLPSQELNQN